MTDRFITQPSNRTAFKGADDMTIATNQDQQTTANHRIAELCMLVKCVSTSKVNQASFYLCEDCIAHYKNLLLNATRIYRERRQQ